MGLVRRVDRESGKKSTPLTVGCGQQGSHVPVLSKEYRILRVSILHALLDKPCRYVFHLLSIRTFSSIGAGGAKVVITMLLMDESFCS